METDLNVLMQRHRDYLDCCTLDESDYAVVDSTRQILLKISEVENRTMAVYDTHKQEYLLLRWKFGKEILCEPNPDESIDPDFFWRLMHPGDRAFVMKAEVCAYQFIKGIPAEERKSYKLILDYRLKNRKGEYIRFTKQLVVLELDRFGEIWLVLVLFDMVSGEPSTEPPCRKIVNMTTGKLYPFSDDECCSTRLFTRQEVEILELVAQGFDSAGIAQKLFISPNTVNNHRKNILRKSNARNTAQAVLYAKRMGVI